jgi:hypothetical protein
MMMKVTISRRAVEERVRRSLEKDGITLRKSRGALTVTMGEYYALTPEEVIMDNQTLEQLAERTQVLKPWEVLPTQ